jgi:hypothetical protein
MRPPSEVLAGIRDSIEEADTAFFKFVNTGNSDYRDEQQEIVAYFLDRAFLELKVFLEAKGILQMLRDVAAGHARAAEDFMKSKMTPWGEPDSFWVGYLRKYLRAVDTNFGSTSPSTVTKELLDILRATLYSITDPNCFPSLPGNETDVGESTQIIVMSGEPVSGKPAREKTARKGRLPKKRQTP